MRGPAVFRFYLLLAAGFSAVCCCAAAPSAGEEFVGPFPSWANIKADYGAVGDGKADDTAAIQKALEAVRSKRGGKCVLYFPAGTYRITSTLKLDRISHHEALGMTIVGEDPQTTIILWAGPAGQNMFHYNPWYSSLCRFTFDGAGKAHTLIEESTAFSTGCEFTDLVLKDAQFGIEAGDMKTDGMAETAVLRCRFYRMAQAGISIQNFNSLDWYIWNCWFEDCGVGATNQFGAGNFHVYQSTFLRSTDADISIRHCGYFSFVDNISIGSRTFFHAKRAPNWKDTETWGSQVTLQDNLVLDPLDPTPIQIENNGPNMLVDNVIRASGDGPIVRNQPPADQADLICVGNVWTARQPLLVKGRVIDMDNKTVPPDQIKDVKPEPAPFLSRARRPTIDVPAGADVASLQAAIDKAGAMKGQRPVVHLPKGDYNLAQTLVIPAGTDLQLVGDGPEDCSQIRNAGGASPLIRVLGPSHATFRNFLVNAGPGAVAIQLENCDQPGSRIYSDQLYAYGSTSYGLVTDQLKNAWVELRDANHNGIQAIGAGPGTQTWVALFCGSSSNGKRPRDIHLYDLQNDARLLVRDIWYEGNGWSLMNLKGSGQFAYHCGFVAPYASDPNIAKGLSDAERQFYSSIAPLEFDGFSGKVSFTLVSTNGADIGVRPPSPGLKLYLLGFFTNRKMEVTGPGIQAQVVGENMRLMRDDKAGTDASASIGASSPEFIRDMLQPLRQVKPRPLTVLNDDITDVRFYRIWADGKNGVRLQAAP